MLMIALGQRIKIVYIPLSQKENRLYLDAFSIEIEINKGIIYKLQKN
jgi:hypothetical protein